MYKIVIDDGVTEKTIECESFVIVSNDEAGCKIAKRATTYETIVFEKMLSIYNSNFVKEGSL